MRKASLLRIVAVGLVAAITLIAVPSAGAKRADHGLNLKKVNPVLMVHGGSGSAQQYETQAMRLNENGYPNRFINAFEYDSTLSLNSFDDIDRGLDTAIANIKQRTGKSQVDVMGHSFGTTQWHRYLNSSPERAANVGHYVNIDGRTADSPPGGVPTLAIWAGRGDPGRSIGGAQNVTVDNQTHVQSATSPESFDAIFKFLTGKEPQTTKIKKSKKKKIKLAGRAELFPQNVAPEHTTALEIWKVAAKTGERKGKHPVAEPKLEADGSWGPAKLRRGVHYEFALLRDNGSIHHIYYEPFRRDDRLVRLLTTNPGEGIESIVDTSPETSGLVAVRNKELWGDQGAQNDVLKIEGQNVINAATSPIDNRTIGMFVFDEGSDRASDVSAPIPLFFSLPFLSAVDLSIPAAPPEGTVNVELRSRGKGPTRKVNFPNFPSATNTVTVQLNDYEK